MKNVTISGIIHFLVAKIDPYYDEQKLDERKVFKAQGRDVQSYGMSRK